MEKQIVEYNHDLFKAATYIGMIENRLETVTNAMMIATMGLKQEGKADKASIDCLLCMQTYVNDVRVFTEKKLHEVLESVDMELLD
jgi:hypothetical protein